MGMGPQSVPDAPFAPLSHSNVFKFSYLWFSKHLKPNLRHVYSEVSPVIVNGVNVDRIATADLLGLSAGRLEPSHWHKCIQVSSVLSTVGWEKDGV